MSVANQGGPVAGDAVGNNQLPPNYGPIYSDDVVNLVWNVQGNNTIEQDQPFSTKISGLIGELDQENQ